MARNTASGSDASAPVTPRRVVTTYLVTSALFTLATSLIWGVNTLFLLGAGLDIFQVMVVNAVFSAGQVLCEVPTGVIADTVGRKTSFLFGIATLLVSTLLYLASDQYAWGMAGFVGASILLGLGYTFQTGAVDAWLVDALDATGFEGGKETVFARGGMVFGTSMLIGTLAGGFLGQIDLAWPFIVRAGILLIAFIATAIMMHEIGFEPRRLALSNFAEETNKIFNAGVRFGWRDPVVRPLLLVSAVQGLFMMFFFYSSQPYALAVLGREDLIWVAAAMTALFGLMGVVGNLCVGLITRSPWGSSASRVLAWGAATMAALTLIVGVLGLLFADSPGTGPFVVLVVSFAVFGFTFGIVGPIRQAYINEHISSGNRATVLSLDSFFDETGGMIGQPGLGWMARVVSIPASYLVGAGLMALAPALYVRSGRAARARRDDEAQGEPAAKESAV